MTTLQDRIVQKIQAQFDALPTKSKPGVDAQGQKQWVPLSGIVMTSDEDTELHCVALATGMKCLPQSKISSANGYVLHDWHAEILAIRLFNSFLLEECWNMLTTGQLTSPYLRRRENHELSVQRGLQPFTINESMRIHMYCSEAPCGDASMELTMSAQDDPTPWKVPVLPEKDSVVEGTAPVLKGRGYFSELGIVRRKPARADSPITLSKSCSDKIALKQCTSLLSSPTSLVISPENAYISTLILPQSQHIPKACERAFSASGRLKALHRRAWHGGYTFKPFEVRSSGVEFSNAKCISGPKSTNVSAAWTIRSQETLINGVLQGRKQTDPRGASMVSRRKLWGLVVQVLGIMNIPAMNEVLKVHSYKSMKETGLLADRRLVKSEAKKLGLTGWVSNEEDDFMIASQSVESLRGC